MMTKEMIGICKSRNPNFRILVFMLKIKKKPKNSIIKYIVKDRIPVLTKILASECRAYQV